MADATAYALGRATDDVAETIRWFQAEGFELRRVVGGPKESFGNVLLEFELGDVRTTIVHDRSQWMLDLAAGAGKPHGLHVWLPAMRGTAATVGPRRAAGEPLPDQLPSGERWCVEVPAVVSWVAGGDRSAEVAAAARDWGRAMRESFGAPGD